MTFDIDEFRAQVDSGFLKPDRYRVRFPIPVAMSQITFGNQLYNTNRYLEFYSDSIDFAGVGVATHNIVRYGYGTSDKKPIAGTFQDVMMTFYSDSTALNYTFFEAWMACVIATDMSSGIAGLGAANRPYEIFYKDEYAVDAMVTLIDANDNEVATWRYRQMFPIDIPTIKLGWSLTNDVQRVTVIFSFTDKYIDNSLGGTYVDLVNSYLTDSQSGVQGPGTDPGVTTQPLPEPSLNNTPG